MHHYPSCAGRPSIPTAEVEVGLLILSSLRGAATSAPRALRRLGCMGGLACEGAVAVLAAAAHRWRRTAAGLHNTLRSGLAL
eukprot:6185605-Pleurochrysis_carterae.AAC.1